MFTARKTAKAMFVVTLLMFVGLAIAEANAQDQEPQAAKGGLDKKGVANKDGSGAKAGPVKLGAKKQPGGDAVAEAIALRGEIEDRQDKVGKVLERAVQLNQRTKDVKSADESREAIAKALDEYIQVTEEFKKLRRAANVAAPLLKKSLADAEPTFKRAADEYGHKAKAMRFPATQQRYTQMAEEARKDAVEYAKDRDEFEAKLLLLSELFDLVEETGQLAIDMKGHLHLYRDANKGRLINDLITSIARQQKLFDGLYGAWREHLDRRRGMAPAAAPGVPPAFNPALPPGVLPAFDPALPPGVPGGPPLPQ